MDSDYSHGSEDKQDNNPFELNKSESYIKAMDLNFAQQPTNASVLKRSRRTHATSFLS